MTRVLNIPFIPVPKLRYPAAVYGSAGLTKMDTAQTETETHLHLNIDLLNIPARSAGGAY